MLPYASMIDFVRYQCLYLWGKFQSSWVHICTLNYFILILNVALYSLVPWTDIIYIVIFVIVYVYS